VFLVHALHDGDFLRSAGEESSVLRFFHADHRGIVLQQQGNREKVVHVFDDDAMVAVCPAFNASACGSNRILAD